jgi:hypothetical protein
MIWGKGQWMERGLTMIREFWKPETTLEMILLQLSHFMDGKTAAQEWWEKQEVSGALPNSNVTLRKQTPDLTGSHFMWIWTSTSTGERRPSADSVSISMRTMSTSTTSEGRLLNSKVMIVMCAQIIPCVVYVFSSSSDSIPRVQWRKTPWGVISENEQSFVSSQSSKWLRLFCAKCHCHWPQVPAGIG